MNERRPLGADERKPPVEKSQGHGLDDPPRHLKGHRRVAAEVIPWTQQRTRANQLAASSLGDVHTAHDESPQHEKAQKLRTADLAGAMSASWEPNKLGHQVLPSLLEVRCR